MNTSIAIQLLSGLIAGPLLGLLYFGGLMWTTRRIPLSQSPAQLALASFITRLGILAMGLFAVVQLGPIALCLSALGMLFFRQLMIRHVERPSAEVS